MSGSAEAMTPATVTGAQVGTLLPGEKAYVTLTVTQADAVWPRPCSGGKGGPGWPCSTC
ncbi:hypothetical protein [Amycolatopsis sp. lyj-346]|uniref:hypothetical protein n=1 Tax=Amycolatopsis sp. lyj-346 TaxID=2789289 RepID=UPI00397AE079